MSVISMTENLNKKNPEILYFWHLSNQKTV